MNQAPQKKGFSEDGQGKKSSMRLMSFVALMASIVFAAMTILFERDGVLPTSGLYITFGFLIAAFAPKAVQKFAEIQIDKTVGPGKEG